MPRSPLWLERGGNLGHSCAHEDDENSYPGAGARRVLVAVSIVTPGTPTDIWAATYNVIVDLQTMIGAIVGLIGLGCAALINAELTRRRDATVLNRKARAIARVMRREIIEIRREAKGAISILKIHRNDDESVDVIYVHAVVIQYQNVFSSSLETIGEMPDEVIDAVTNFYTTVDESIHIIPAMYVTGRNVVVPKDLVNFAVFITEAVIRHADLAVPILNGWLGIESD